MKYLKRAYAFVGGFLYLMTRRPLEWSTRDQKNHRAEQCAGCFANEKDFCNGCGCYIPFKISVRENTCPHKIWKQ